VWQFNQKELIDQVKAVGNTVSPESSWWLFSTPRRANYDMAAIGYTSHRHVADTAQNACRVHVAPHGCKQNAKDFATKAGHNNWAEYYQVIVVYPATEPNVPAPEEVCSVPPLNPLFDLDSGNLNPNGCWDWWGYLDGWWVPKNRYLTKEAPQIQVIERIISKVTAPLETPR
jgi:hypothetical protein